MKNQPKSDSVDSRKAIAEIEINSERYQTLGLRFNPFPAGGMSPSNPQIEPFPETREDILDFFRKFLVNKSSKGLVLLGTYGAGKTYHLNHIRAILQEAKANIRIIQVSDPGIDPYQIIRSILINIGEEEVGNMIWNWVRHYLSEQLAHDTGFFAQFTRTSSKKKSAIGTSALFADIISISEDDWADYRRFFRALDRYHLIDRENLLSHIVLKLIVPQSMFHLTSHPKVAEDLVSLCIYEDVPALNRWKGMTEGIGAGTIKPGDEKYFLQALIRLFNSNGIQYFVLLLDEFEKVSQLERLTAKETKRYLETLRILIDTAQDDIPFTYVLATNYDAWKLATDTEQSLQHRFYVLELPSTAEPAVANYLVASYLALARLVPAKSGLSPFPETLIDQIPVPLRSTPRQLIRICHELIEEALREQSASVTEDIIKRLLRNPAYFGGQATLSEGNLDVQ